MAKLSFDSLFMERSCFIAVVFFTACAVASAKAPPPEFCTPPSIRFATVTVSHDLPNKTGQAFEVACHGAGTFIQGQRQFNCYYIYQQATDRWEFELDRPMPSCVSAPCKSAGFSYNPSSHTCVLFHWEQAINVYEARDACAGLAAQVVKVTSAVKNSALAKLTRGQPTWIDLVQASIGHWTLHNSQLSTTVYTNWAAGQPDGEGSEDCAIMQGDGTFADKACTDSFPFTCEYSPCKGTGYQYNNALGKCIGHFPNPIAPDTATTACTQEASSLLLLDSNATRNAALQLMGKNGVWVNLFYAGGNKFVSTYGVEKAVNTYSHWKGGSASAAGTGRCVALQPDGYMVRESCESGRRGRICTNTQVW